MATTKYLRPSAYGRRLNRMWIGLNLKFNKNYVCTAQALSRPIRFYVDTWAEYEMRVKGSYIGEPTTVSWIEEIVRPNDCVYDIGANVGAYTLLLGKRMQDAAGKGVIYAIEPEAGNFYKLNRNVHLNGLSEYVLPVCTAFGPESGLQHFHLQSLEVGSACHGLGAAKSEGKAFSSLHQQGVVAYSLDAFVQQPGVRFPNHLKIDVDGLEKEIVRSGLTVLKDPRLRSLVIEINNQLSNGSLERIIESCGMEELRRDQWKDIHNILYVRR